MELDEISYRVEDAIAIVTLDRPVVLNAISGRAGGTRDQLLHALDLAAADPAVGCVVLRGNGRAFCGGGDLTGNERRETLAEHQAFLERADEFHGRLSASAKPVVAAVHGYCLGAGVLLASACDLVVAGETARFGFPEGRMGLVGVTPLVAVIGRQWAKFLILTGELITAERAREIGLVLTVEPDAELFDRVLDLADRIARMPRAGVEHNRRSIDAVADAAGATAGRAAAIAHDAATLAVADRATAPDGRTFRSIVEAEGVDGLKRAREAQYLEPWLRAGGRRPGDS
jgi:enoyl-CoA hydratase/carnithine racemase